MFDKVGDGEEEIHGIDEYFECQAEYIDKGNEQIAHVRHAFHDPMEMSVKKRKHNDHDGSDEDDEDILEKWFHGAIDNAAHGHWYDTKHKKEDGLPPIGPIATIIPNSDDPPLADGVDPGEHFFEVFDENGEKPHNQRKKEHIHETPKRATG